MAVVRPRAFQSDFLIFGFSFFLSLLLLLLDIQGILSTPKGLSKILVSPITSYFYNVSGNGFDIFSSNLAQKDQEIEKLKIQNANLSAQLAQLKSIEEENIQARRLLGTNIPPSWKFSPARVIAKNADTLTLLSDSQVQVGQIVILPKEENLEEVVRQYGIYLGKVGEHQGASLKVLLPTSTSSKVGVVVRSFNNFDKKATGILAGRGSRALLDQVLISEDLSEGDWILTSGSEGGEGLREELLVGKVEKIISGSNTTFKQAEVTLAVDSAKLDRVFLVTKKDSNSATQLSN